MNKSESIAALAASMAKAQAEMSNPVFDKVNPHFRSSYASLAAVRNAIVPPMAKHGLSIMQDVTTAEDGVTVLCKTLVTHTSGEWIEFGPLAMRAARGDAQGLGSVTTYAKRYALQSVCGVVGDEDDDGNEAAQRNGNNNGREQRPEAPVAMPADMLKSALDSLAVAETVVRLTKLFEAGLERAKQYDDKAAAKKIEAAFTARRKVIAVTRPGADAEPAANPDQAGGA